MTHPSKRKGNGFEREVVKLAQAYGLDAERARGSDGRSLGHAETVDLVVEGYTIQAKRRKAIPKWLAIAPEFDAVVTRPDGGGALIVLPLEDWLEDQRRIKQARVES